MRVLLAILILAAVPAEAESLVAQRLIRPGSVIGAGDVAPGAVQGGLAPDAEIVGLEARAVLYPGQPIRPGDVGAPALVERNQPVTLVYRTGGVTILAEARALSRGAVGDTVRAMNLASRSTVSGRVAEDGTVIVSNGDPAS